MNKSAVDATQTGLDRFTDPGGTKGLLGLGEQTEPRTWDRMHVTAGSSYDCATTLPRELESTGEGMSL